jgi:hypothetical protein
MIILDYSQIAMSVITNSEFKPLLVGGDETQVKNIVRHAILNTILSYKNKYSKEYGQVVIAADGRNYWRKEVFPYYKGDRKKSREKSDMNWKLIFDCMTSIREDIKEYFPYKVMHIDRAEADDIIAILSEWSQTNELASTGLFEEPQKIMIISSDHDFLQLQKWDNIYQFSPIIKKQLKMSKRDLYEKYITHIVKASDDGIPNILSDDSAIVTEGVRQTPVSAKRLAEFIELGKAACKNDTEIRNWDRNEQLISFEKIPVDIKETIIDEYIKCKPKMDRMRIMNYLIQNRCKLLLDKIEEF